jgi:hypothetical protein
MNIILLLKSIEATFEVIFLCLAVYYLIRGIKIKNFRKAGMYFCFYIVLNVIRRIVGY